MELIGVEPAVTYTEGLILGDLQLVKRIFAGGMHPGLRGII